MTFMLIIERGLQIAVVAAAKELLVGVGQIPSAVEQHEVAIHYRKTLSVSEIAKLSMDWCSIPAIDEAGEGILLERDT